MEGQNEHWAKGALESGSAHYGDNRNHNNPDPTYTFNEGIVIQKSFSPSDLLN